MPQVQPVKAGTIDSDATVVVVLLCRLVAESSAAGDETECTSMLFQIGEAVRWVASYDVEEPTCVDDTTYKELRASIINVLTAFAEGSHNNTKILLRSILDACGNESAQYPLTPFSQLITLLLSSDGMLRTFALELGGLEYLVSRICGRTESCQYSFVSSMMKLQRQLYGAPVPVPTAAS